MNQYMTPGLYAVLPEIVEDAIAPLTSNGERKASARFDASNGYFGYRRPNAKPEPIVIKLPANS